MVLWGFFLGGVGGRWLGHTELCLDLLLIHCLGITTGSDQEITCGARNRVKVGCMQGKCLNPSTFSLVMGFLKFNFLLFI